MKCYNLIDTDSVIRGQKHVFVHADSDIEFATDGVKEEEEEKKKKKIFLSLPTFNWRANKKQHFKDKKKGTEVCSTEVYRGDDRVLVSLWVIMSGDRQAQIKAFNLSYGSLRSAGQNPH